jgi:hypothetical protein
VDLVNDAQFDFDRPDLVNESRCAFEAVIAAGYSIPEKLEKVDEAAIGLLADLETRVPGAPAADLSALRVHFAKRRGKRG